MSVLAAVAATALSASQADPVLITSYQSLGVDAATAGQLGQGFRAGANKPPLSALSADASDASGRASVMCGEDAACLSTVGQRAGAKYVLAYGVGKVGTSLLVSAIFIDVSTGKEITRASKRVLDEKPDWTLVTRELSDLVVKPPAEPLVVQVPVTIEVPAKAHKWRTPAFIGVGGAAVFGVISTVFALSASSNFYGALTTAANTGNSVAYATAVGNQHILNAGADVSLFLGVIAIGVATIFFILDRRDAEPPTFETSPVAPAAPSW